MGSILYRELASKLRRRILSGQLPPGSRLPTERELCLQLGASRITVRGALDILEAERLLRRVQGSGTYVSEQPARRIPLTFDYTRSVNQHAPGLKRKLIDHAFLDSDPVDAESLNIVTGKRILVARRLDSVQGTPTAWDRARIPEDYAGKLNSRLLSRVDFIEAWSQAERLEIEHCEQTVEAKTATDEDIAFLGLDFGQPVLVATERFILKNSRIAGAFTTHYKPDLVYIRSQFKW